ncbi:MAG: hypothetical protein AAF517_06545 [Planctomycetota bacterium]
MNPYSGAMTETSTDGDDVNRSRNSFRWRGFGQLGWLTRYDATDVSSASESARVEFQPEAPGPFVVDEAERESNEESDTARIKASRLYGEFVRSGGRRLTVVRTHSEGGELIGEDGGAGERTGLASFLDLEEVSAVVVPDLLEVDVDAFLDFSELRPDLLLILGVVDGAGDDRATVEVWSSNVVLVRGRHADMASLHVAGAIDAVRDQPTRRASVSAADVTDSAYDSGASAEWEARRTSLAAAI